MRSPRAATFGTGVAINQSLLGPAPSARAFAIRSKKENVMKLVAVILLAVMGLTIVGCRVKARLARPQRLSRLFASQS